MGMGEGKTIEVLLASYDGEKYIRQQMDSILDQSIPGLRILVSDDGSKDGTVEILRQYTAEYPERVALLEEDADVRADCSGIPGVRRKAAAVSASDRNAAVVPAPAGNFFRLLANADADYILLSDQDDVWLPEKVERLLERIRGIEGEDGGVPALVFSDMEVVDEGLNQIAPSFFSYAHCDPRRLALSEILAENPVTGGALMMNRALLELVRATPRACFMHDWWIALCASCFGRISCVREALSLYRQHGANVLGARPSGSFREIAERLARQAQVEENYRRMFAQAEAFLEMYEERLTDAQKLTLKAWIGLPAQTPSERLKTIWKYHFYKSAPVQTLAMCVTVPRRAGANLSAGCAGMVDLPAGCAGMADLSVGCAGMVDLPAGCADMTDLPAGSVGMTGTTVCVIVNYNDAETAAGLAGQIAGYGSLDHIVLVDNASTDDSYERLKMLEGGKITVIRAEKNGGYGAGNNLGVRYAAQRLGAVRVLIANPDVMFTDRCVRNLSRILARHPEAGVAAAVMRNGSAAAPFPPQNAWRLHGFVGELLYMGPVSRRIFRNRLYYPASYYKDRTAVPADVVHGSMLMVDAAAFLACGGYDEGIFLYQEEMVLGRRMKAAGRRTVLLLKESYIHQDSVSISKSISDALRRQRLREQSVMYYMEHYLGIGPARKALAKLWFAVIRLETRIYLWYENLCQKMKRGGTVAG